MRRVSVSRVLTAVVLGSIVTSALLFASFMVYVCGSGRFWAFGEAETFLLPAGYEGPVTLVFNDSAGSEPGREGPARVYDFRDRRVLRLRVPPPERTGTPDFFYVDARGVRQHLARGERCAPGRAPIVYVCADWGRSADGRGRVYDSWLITRDPATVGDVRRVAQTDVDAIVRE